MLSFFLVYIYIDYRVPAKTRPSWDTAPYHFSRPTFHDVINKFTCFLFQIISVNLEVDSIVSSILQRLPLNSKRKATLNFSKNRRYISNYKNKSQYNTDTVKAVLIHWLK